jgi:peptidoglycan/LPS O-acetylase OafA/YrhL
MTPVSPAPGSPSNLTALTGLRFVAATSVFVHHLVGVLWLPDDAVGTANLGMTVSLFFVLSGFVLTHAYAHRAPHRAPLRFATQRFFRIWPAHAVVFVFSLFLFWPDGTRWFRDNFSNLELLQILAMGQAWSSEARIFWGVNAVAWSISVEWFFYLLFPLLAWIGRRSSRLLALVGAATSGTWLLVTEATVSLDMPFEAGGWGQISPVARLAEFVLGILTHRIVFSRSWSARAQRSTAIEVAALVLACAAVFWAAPLADRFFDNGSIVHAWFGGAGAAPVFAVLIAVLALGHGAVSAVLSTSVFQWLGRVSFAEYLVHQRLIVYWQRKVVPLDWPVAIEVMTLVMTVLAMSALIHRFVELPGVRLGRRITTSR